MYEETYSVVVKTFLVARPNRLAPDRAYCFCIWPKATPSAVRRKIRIKMEKEGMGRMNPLAPDVVALAAAVFDLYADHGKLGWDAFATVVRGSGFDTSESQLAEMWAKTTGTIADEGRSEKITFPEFCAGLQSAPGPADGYSALAAIVGQRRLTAEAARKLLTTVGDEPLSDSEWSAFAEVFFPDGSARSVSDLEMTFREEDPATSSQPFYVQGRERLRARGERKQAAAMAEAGFAQTSQTDRGASERQDAAEQVSAAKIELKEAREAPATSALTESRTAEPKVEDKNPAPEIAQSDEKRDERQVFPLCAISVPCNHLCNGL